MLFKANGANYAIDPTVQTGTVTATLERVPMRSVLDTILRSSPVPLTYRFENGIYSILPKAADQDSVPSVPGTQTIMIRGDQLVGSAKTIVERIKGLPAFGPQSDMKVLANPDDNSITATMEAGPDFDVKLRKFREAVRLFDVLPQRVYVNAEVILLVTDRAGRTHRSVLTSAGRTISEHEVQLKAANEGKVKLGASGLTMESGRYDLHVNPVVNGDRSISYDAHGTLDFTYGVPSSGASLHLHKEFNGADRMQPGSTVPIASAVQKLSSGTTAETAELLVFLTIGQLDPPKANAEKASGAVRPLDPSR